ncbi:MAG: hypothetical protein ACM3JH_15465, partial [Acidithiobacillales bacterium]
MNGYEGSPSLALDAREKVRQTFRHTLQLARDGRNEEALLGCDFILKMDSRFSPAHRLLESLRGVPAGKRVDLAQFASFLQEPPPPETQPPAGGGPFEADAALSAPPPPPPPATPPGGLDELVFDDFASREPAAASAPRRPSPSKETSFAGLTDTPAPVVAAARPAAPARPVSAPSEVFQDLDLSVATESAPAGPAATPPPPAPSAAAPARPAAGAEPSGAALDPRIAQFLKQGDDALVRGNAQEAIDLWSRVFLIDLSNEAASKRIDAAREALADTARKVDVLLSEAVQLYDAGNLQAARAKFLDVLAHSEHDATARSYLNQIDAAMAAPGAGAAAPGDSEFLRTEIEAPVPPSYAEEDEGADPGRTLAVVVPDEAAPSPVVRKAAPAP